MRVCGYLSHLLHWECKAWWTKNNIGNGELPWIFYIFDGFSCSSIHSIKCNWMLLSLLQSVSHLVLFLWSHLPFVTSFVICNFRFGVTKVMSHLADVTSPLYNVRRNLRSVRYLKSKWDRIFTAIYRSLFWHKQYTL